MAAPRTCSVADCKKPLFKLGYCVTHYSTVRSSAASSTVAGFDEKDLKQNFDLYDRDGNGSIDCKEIAAICKTINFPVTDAQIKEAIAEVDSDSNGTIEWNEFLKFMNLVKGQKPGSKFLEINKPVISAKDSILKAMKDATPVDPTPKKSWKVANVTSAPTGKWKSKKAFAKPPPEKKSITDLP